MYNMILVDDEAIIRDGISRCLPWEENGFSLSGVFEHGRQALEYIETHPVDLVLSDINMPFMDGLELSRILGERFPGITVILLTGYDDFEYAQEAVKYQVREFLLKPITSRELSEILQTVKEELDHKAKERNNREELTKKLEESFPLLRERLLYRLVTGRTGTNSADVEPSWSDWRDFEGCYQVLNVSFPHSWGELDRISLTEKLKGSLAEGDSLFFNPHDELVLLLQGDDRDELSRRSYFLAGDAFRIGASSGQKPISVGCGEVVESRDQIKLSYRGARSSVEYSRLMGVSHIISAEEIRDRGEASASDMNGYCMAVVNRIKEGGREQGAKAFEEYLVYLESCYLTPVQLKAALARLFFFLESFVREMDLILPGEDLPPWESVNSLGEARIFFSDMLEEVDRRISQRRNDMLYSRIDKAKDLITSRFRESRLSLRDLCDELYLSSSQFSLLFKEGTGKTFVEYLTGCRIEEAKNLLITTDLKGYEIAEKVGYSDPRYFTIIFKKQTGMTAMEYRRSRRS